MLNNVVDIINSMDFLNLFGFFPKLKIQKKECYKSDLGAIVFLVYFFIFWYYVISVTIDYINSFDEVDTVKILTDDTTNYNISVNDIYFGIGIISPTTQKMLNIYDYPGLEFGLQFVKMNSEGKNSIQINLTKCDVTLFFSNNDWNNLTSDRQKYISNDLSFYLCPDTNSFSKMLIPYQYLQNYSYYQFYVKADNDSVLNSTLKNLSMSKPRVQFIWSAVSIDSKVKDIPYKTFIDFFQSSFHSTEFEEIDIFLNANSIYDDDNRLNSGYTVYKNNNYSTQAMGEIFTVSKIEYHTIDQYSRIIPTGSNETDHLYFQKIKINLSKNFIKIYRNYSKFVDFLASTTALTSNILFFLIILMDYINSILAKHILLKTLFSSNSIKRLQEFEDDFNKVLNEDKKEETSKKILN